MIDVINSQFAKQQFWQLLHSWKLYVVCYKKAIENTSLY